MVANQRIREPVGDRLFLVIIAASLVVVLVIMIYPLLYVASASVSDPIAVNAGSMILFPKHFTLEGYERVFADREIWIGYRNTIFYTLVGVAINLLVTLPAAYSLSKKKLKFQGLFMFLFIFTMFFNGGLIPTYLVVRNLGMVNKVWALLIPGAATVWNLIVTRTYFQGSVPDELEEAAEIDGCSPILRFVYVVLPISKPIIAVMALFYGVGHWNEYFNALIYLSNRQLFPLQLILREILVLNQVNIAALMSSTDIEFIVRQARIAELIKFPVMVVGALPMLIAYPFVQRFFVKGVLLGSLKG